jgi:hypothetical protein
MDALTHECNERGQGKATKKDGTASNVGGYTGTVND